MTPTTPLVELSPPLAYIETTIPSGMTLEEYRRSRPQRRRRCQRLRPGARDGHPRRTHDTRAADWLVREGQLMVDYNYPHRDDPHSRPSC
jgi:hypothetical protein